MRIYFTAQYNYPCSSVCTDSLDRNIQKIKDAGIWCKKIVTNLYKNEPHIGFLTKGADRDRVGEIMDFGDWQTNAVCFIYHSTQPIEIYAPSQRKIDL